MKQFRGTGVAIVTPFKKDSSIDFVSMGRVINHVIDGGVDYIVLMGTTGESVTLTLDEKSALTSFALESVDNRIPIIIGIGGNNTQEIINYIKQADLSGISGILSVAPYYNKPSQRGLFQHFKAIAACSSLPIILYNVPGRTASNISADTCLQLANECENIVAIKEASGDLCQIMKIIKGKPEKFSLISGDDLLTIPIIAAGGNGVISVMANAFPSQCSMIVKHALENKFDQARAIQFRFIEMVELLFKEGNPSGVKAALRIMNLCQDNLRLPLVPVSSQLYELIEKEIKEVSRN